MSFSERQQMLINREVNNIMVAMKIAEQWDNDTKLNNFDLNGHPTNITEGYMVAFRGGAVLNKVKSYNNYDMDQVKQAILKLLDINVHLGYIGYIGFWENEDKLYIDLSVNMFLINPALTFGHMQEQIAIYDIKNQKSVIVADYLHLIT
jgi:hypothetical protein